MEFQSTIRRSRWQKFSALVARLAIEVAKEKSDPAYAKYKLSRDKYIETKRSINNRYKVEAFKRARAAVRKTAIAAATVHNKQKK